MAGLATNSALAPPTPALAGRGGAEGAPRLPVALVPEPIGDGPVARRRVSSAPATIASRSAVARRLTAWRAVATQRKLAPVTARVPDTPTAPQAACRPTSGVADEPAQ